MGGRLSCVPWSSTPMESATKHSLHFDQEQPCALEKQLLEPPTLEVRTSALRYGLEMFQKSGGALRKRVRPWPVLPAASFPGWASCWAAGEHCVCLLSATLGPQVKADNQYEKALLSEVLFPEDVGSGFGEVCGPSLSFPLVTRAESALGPPVQRLR